MSRVRVVVLVVVAVLALLVTAVGWYLRPIGPVATGYAAKTLCSGVFVSGRDASAVEGDLPDNPLVPFLRWTVDEDDRTVRATLLGAFASTAWFADGLGCTLSADDPGLVGRALPAASTLAEAAAPEVEAAIAVAFEEDDPDGRLRNTRAVVVLQDGRLVGERYADGFGPQTPLLGWSMAKSVANAIAGRLVDQGRLDLTDADLLPQWADDDRSLITLHDLLRMSSGLAFEEVYDPDTDATNMLFVPQDMGAYAADKPLVAPPGTVWSYSSGTTNIVCDIAQEASGLGTGMARELVFAPLGMASAVLEPDATGGLACSSFLYATARDWARFGQWFLQDGVWEGERLLPEGWVEGSTRPVELDTENPYGAHWWLNEGPDGDLRMPTVPADAYWASGNEGQHVVVIPSRDVVVVRLGLTSDFDGIEWGLERLLVAVLDAL